MARASRPKKSAGVMFSQPPLHGLGFGVLRTRYAGRDNDAVDFISRKLCPGVKDPIAKPPTAARIDVLLPPAASDIFLDPLFLVRSFVDQLPQEQKDLVIALRVMPDPTRPLHEGWERARAYARDTLVNSHGLPVIMVLHDPSMCGHHDPNPPHIHIFALARRLALRGWAERSRLARDSAHDELAVAWQAAS
jgi:hypothetical protein